MKPNPEAKQRLTTELLILPDGRVLVHNLTPAFARLLHELNPNDAQIHPRAARKSRLTPNASRPNELPN